MGAQETAQAQVALKYDPQQAAIERQIQAIKDQTAANEAGLNTYGSTGRTAIGNVYDTLNSLLTNNRQQSAADIGQAAQLVGGGYDAANAFQNAVANAGRQRLSALAQHLGAGAAGELQVQTPQEETLANILGQNAQARASATGNLNTWGTQWDQILGNGINIGEQTRATKLSDFETELMKLLGQNKVTGLEGQNEQYGRLSDIIGARQNDLLVTYNQLAQQEWENAFRQAQLDQQAQSENARLSLQAAGMEAENARANRASSQAGQLTAKDLLQLAMSEGERSDAQKQQMFENGLAAEGMGLDRAKFRASLQGGNPNEVGDQALLKFVMGEDFTNDDAGMEDLLGRADTLTQLGFGNSFMDNWVAQQQQLQQQQAADAARNQSNSIATLAGNFLSAPTQNRSIDDAWWNPVKMGGLVRGLSSMFRR